MLEDCIDRVGGLRRQARKRQGAVSRIVHGIAGGMAARDLERSSGRQARRRRGAARAASSAAPLTDESDGPAATPA
eukprot:9140239-Alexandrium_andersonii.AAC.1